MKDSARCDNTAKIVEATIDWFSHLGGLDINNQSKLF